MLMSTIAAYLFDVMLTFHITKLLHFNYKLNRFCFNYFNGVFFIFT